MDMSKGHFLGIAPLDYLYKYTVSKDYLYIVWSPTIDIFLGKYPVLCLPCKDHLWLDQVKFVEDSL